MFHNTAFPALAWAMALALGVGLGVAPPAVPAPPSAQPTYESTFEGYRPFTDSPASGWAGANRSAADVGGWKAYAKAARAPSSGAAAQGLPGDPDAQGGTAGPAQAYPAPNTNVESRASSGHAGHAHPGVGAHP